MRFAEFHLGGCRVLPGQVWGSVRVAGIVRDEVVGDLRLTPKEHDDWSVRSTYKRADFFSYMPRAYVLDWSADGSAVATAETHLGKHRPVKMGKLWRRRSKNALAFLPQSLAIEGFLVRHFKGPNIAWLDYDRLVRRGNLGVRIERSLPGWYLNGLVEALRLFEFGPNQVGAAVFFDEELINCFVTPHPADYSRLHESLLQDLYPEHLIHYGYLRDRDPHFPLALDQITDLASLKKQYYKTLEDLAGEETYRLEVLMGRALEGERLFKCGPFHLERFTTALEENDNFCGEVITRGDDTVEYLKMYRLSRAQSNRLRFLQTLAKHDWELAAAAEELGFPGADGMARALVTVDLGYLLNPGVYARLFR
jgi:ARPP-2-like protein